MKDPKCFETCLFYRWENGDCTFIKYDNIYRINYPTLRGDNWYLEIHTSDYKQKLTVHYDTKKEGKRMYKKIVKAMKRYYSNSLQQKLDKLLAHIDVLPGNETGGKDFEEAKERFVEIKDNESK